MFSFLHFLLDILFPPSPEVKRIESSTPEEILGSVPRARDLPHSYVQALFEYRHQTTRTMIWELKYRGNRRIAKLLARILFDVLLDEEADLLVFSNFKNPLIIPVPLSSKRFRERGFNQIALLIEELGKIDQGNVFEFPKNVVRKRRHTETQTSIRNKKKRSENVKDCFEVRKPVVVQGRNIIILDDVVTTGSTMAEVRRTLLSAGARRVIGIALAH